MLNGRSEEEFEGIHILCQVNVVDSDAVISFQNSFGVSPNRAGKHMEIGNAMLYIKQVLSMARRGRNARG